MIYRLRGSYIKWWKVPLPLGHCILDLELLEELLNFDPSFWQFVVDGAGLGGPGNEGTTSIPT